MISSRVIQTLPFFVNATKRNPGYNMHFIRGLLVVDTSGLRLLNINSTEFIDIVVYQENEFSDRPDKIRYKLVSIKYLAVK